MISVVTICFNEINNIRRRIESVAMQNSDQFEYVICDGLSNDGTVDIIREYEKVFKNKRIPFVFSSEKDNGIYDAMNKAVQKTKGDYILFINAGDEIYDSETIEECNNIIRENPLFDVYYGNCVYIERGVEKGIICNHEGLLHNMTVCHPSCLVSRSRLLDHQFDISFKSSADYENFVNLVINDAKYYHIDRYLSYFYFWWSKYYKYKRFYRGENENLGVI